LDVQQRRALFRLVNRLIPASIPVDKPFGPGFNSAGSVRSAKL
jgi:hypothetical protein